jgi:hypothetical protein
MARPAGTGRACRSGCAGSSRDPASAPGSVARRRGRRFHPGSAGAGIVFQISGIVFQISGVVIQISGTVFQISGAIFQISGIVFQISGRVFQRYGKQVFHIAGLGAAGKIREGHDEGTVVRMTPTQSASISQSGHVTVDGGLLLAGLLAYLLDGDGRGLLASPGQGAQVHPGVQHGGGDFPVVHDLAGQENSSGRQGGRGMKELGEVK